jgi:hypothetical protein
VGEHVPAVNGDGSAVGSAAAVGDVDEEPASPVPLGGPA